ncbi:dihydrofolate reductase motif-containing protein [Pandoravirus inopinatum]|uniref:Dihydrofolate reductase motif-containing protein n=1 Tax=Pandoravirus inopinatum TaxID=1605721 RepID=A0A0B5JCU0_9VIRU|nr:dihydrofolate reductase motif-containing protein [Pandoravirus inopinatum]AJF97482.1 dihydrofolate reductase motif-containing protein [Pandoravirus inopinatum]
MDTRAVRVCLFASIDADGWIGYNNCLPSELVERGQSDVLRAVTRGKTVIIGRKSVAAFRERPPGEHVIVMTRALCKRSLDARDDVIYASTPIEALAKCPTPEVVVLGGARTFWSFLPYASELRVCALAACVRRPDTLRSIAGAQWAEAVPKSATAEQRDGFQILTWFVEQPTRQPADEPSKPYWEKVKEPEPDCDDNAIPEQEEEQA